MIVAVKANGPVWFVIPCAILVAFGFVASVIRYRKRGPAVGYVPRRWRPKVNEWFSGHGWDKPYDENGETKPRW